MMGNALGPSLSEAVKVEQGMLRSVLDQSRDCIKLLSPEGEVNYINSEGRCALGTGDAARFQGKRWPELWPTESRPIVESALQKAQSGESTEFEASRPDSTGETRWWRISVSPLIERRGELAGMLTISRDNTSDVARRETEHTLALEMRHRLRNAYTIAGAIVMQSARGTPETQPFAESVCARLADVALSQEQLLEAGKKNWVLADLVRTLAKAHGDGAAAIRSEGVDVTVDGHEAMLIALIVGELTNNSLKYGALNHALPVWLTWSMDDALSLEWREPLASLRGKSLEPRDINSGYAMMERMARVQRARFNQEIVDRELRVTLTLPKPR